MHVFGLEGERLKASVSGMVQLRTEYFGADMLPVDRMSLGYGVIFDGASAQFHPTGTVGSILPPPTAAGTVGPTRLYGAYDPSVQSYVTMTGGERFRYAGVDHFVRLNPDGTVTGNGAGYRIVVDVYDERVAAQWFYAEGWNVGDVAYFDGTQIQRIVNGSVVASVPVPDTPAPTVSIALQHDVYFDISDSLGSGTAYLKKG